MKKNQNNNQSNISLPVEVCNACGFGAEGLLGLHAGPGALVVMDGKMTVLELANAINTINVISSDLMVALAKSAGLCDGCGEMPGHDPAECIKVCTRCHDIFDENERIRLPESVLEDAGLCEDTKLEAYVDEDSGEIYITAADVQEDVTDLPPGILSVLVASGVCLAELDERIMMEDIVYGNE